MEYSFRDLALMGYPNPLLLWDLIQRSGHASKIGSSLPNSEKLVIGPITSQKHMPGSVVQFFFHCGTEITPKMAALVIYGYIEGAHRYMAGPCQ